jgi:predicted enzyme related to lactoylglutathione lyase
MKILGLDLVQLAAPPGCEESALSFFSGVLGLDEIEKPEALHGRGGVWFAAGPHQLHIGVEEAHSPARKAHPAFAARDLDALATRLEAAGAEVEWEDRLPGLRRFYTSDPWGNRIEVVAG